MKLLNLRFFSGVVIVSIGLLCLALGVRILIPPNNDVLTGALLLVSGPLLMKCGKRVAADRPPQGSKTAANILKFANDSRKDPN